jgi:hypothetical protein
MSNSPWDKGFVSGAKAERDRIIKLLESQAAIDKHLPFLVHLIALIKGESKTNPWTTRPLTEEDVEHYGLEGEK